MFSTGAALPSEVLWTPTLQIGQHPRLFKPEQYLYVSIGDELCPFFDNHPSDL